MKTWQLTIFVFVTIAVMQTLYMIIPINTVQLYNMALRPLIYTMLAVTIFVFTGLDARPVRKAFTANMFAILSILIFGIVFLLISFLFGAGVNAETVAPHIIVRNLWERGLVVILGELIRYKLIKNTDKLNRMGVVLILTIILAYGQMNAIRTLIHTDIAAWAIFYESVFRHLAISAVASFFAIKGNFTSVILISFVYTMAPYLTPIMPNILPLAWALTVSGLVVATAIAYHFITDNKKSAHRKREKRAAKYEKKPILTNVLTVAVISVLIAFFAGMFPIYPVVILTGSMAGTFERGSLVFVERVRPDEAFIRVGEGYVIHFLSRNRLEYIHRVIDFTLDRYGEREYITQGDASEIIDPFPVRQGDVLGIARASIPFFGYPYIFFQAVFRVLG